jgi:tetrahydromethanopterin S-methyltransferase subunit G
MRYEKSESSFDSRGEMKVGKGKCGTPRDEGILRLLVVGLIIIAIH